MQRLKVRVWLMGIYGGYRIYFSLYRTASRLAVFLSVRRALVTEDALYGVGARVAEEVSGKNKRSKVA